ncbi:type II RES/Xre toxin-antitoxin system antitoxin [Pseudomonas piscis]|uniref:type II RES/Xre toxin-antitoxin system antitoxin n=1 Tax=Pseudomonas piscis TaxID=2614538 RepID=UPI0003FF4847|nr:antitoxin Xre/MbcA/ParS toxin-binding domain-containing protein [Pseudomonas piscis]
MVAMTGSDIAVKRRGKPVLKDRTSEILLGGRARFDDRISIYRLTEEGIPLAAIVKFVSSVPMLKDEQVLAKIIGLSERTLHRRLKTPDEPLNPEQSARAVRFAQVLSKAQEIFGSSEQAQEWMAKPVMALDGHKPVDLLTNPIGFELVDEFLTRLEYGVYQ